MCDGHAGEYHGSTCILIDNAINENICIAKVAKDESR